MVHEVPEKNTCCCGSRTFNHLLLIRRVAAGSACGFSASLLSIVQTTIFPDLTPPIAFVFLLQVSTSSSALAFVVGCRVVKLNITDIGARIFERNICT